MSDDARDTRRTMLAEPPREHAKARAFLAVLLLLGIACGDGTTDPAPPSSTPVATWVELSQDAVTLTALGDTARLTVTVRDQNGAQMQAAVAWSSGDTAVAVVDASGLVTAVATGSATITATAGAASGDAVAFVSQVVSSMVVEPAEGTIAQGDTLRLTATVLDSGGAAIPGVLVDWSSSDPEIVVVFPDGVVRGVAEGWAVIRAKADSVEATAEITVSPSPDRAVLVALYEATDGPNWVNSDNWLSDRPLGEWYGVETDSWGRVVGIHLNGPWRSPPGHGLSGELPSELGKLSSLETLNLNNNQLTGEIPPELAQLSNLVTLDLSWNRLTGEMPVELGQLSNLVTLSFGGYGRGWNQLTGEIPPELGQLANLERLNLSGNQLTGEIPSVLGHLLNLTALYLTRNQLTGEVPSELGQLTELRNLTFNYNQLTGEIPGSYLELSNLFEFRIEVNDGLCAPGTGAFVDWLGTIAARRGDSGDVFDGSYCNEGDRETLAELFGVWGGANWNDSNGWLESNALERWHGVEADSSGYVVTLDLRRNGLSGLMASNPARLHRLTTLRLDDNEALDGRLPLALTTLDLTELTYTSTGICAPTDEPFRQWLNSIDTHEGTIDCAPLSDREVLELLYASTGGGNWTNSQRWLSEEPLDAWHGVDADTTGQVVRLDLRANGLEGPLPPELGELSQLTALALSANQLSGVLPDNLTELQLESFEFHVNDGLCAPGTRAFAAWMDGMASSSGPYCNRRDIVALEVLFQTTTGEGWKRSDGWLDSPALGEWYGVDADSLGRVVTLDLTDNGLSGRLPVHLGHLVHATTLRIGNNEDLSGSLPLSLAELDALSELDYSGTELCVPDEPSFRDWLRAVGTHRGTGLNCAPGPTDREILRLLYEATDGPNWLSNDNWLSDRPLHEWYGVETDGDGRVVHLNLSGRRQGLQWLRNLAGEIPPELGQLSKLKTLRLRINQLTGEIPPELGQLHNLEYLDLGWNGFTGEIPPELAQLSNLERLDLSVSGLTGEIPIEFGELSNLTYLDLGDNFFTGKIPPQLGQLHNLEYLTLYRNALTGEIPTELGQLLKLVHLDMEGNRLTGQIPPSLGRLSSLTYLNLWANNLTGDMRPELGQLSRLRHLNLEKNQLTGEMPTSFLDLSELSNFRFWSNDGLCAPGTAEFVDWLEGMANSEGPYCNEGDRSALTQLFNAWDGGRWTESTGWMESNALERWHGVDADSSGRVVALDLRRNGLSGSMNANLARLHRLTTLRLDDNDLIGRLPLALTTLGLSEVSYTGTAVCAPADEEFRQWLSSLSAHNGTGLTCEPPSDRQVLEWFYASTGGPDWGVGDNWLTDRPLDDWQGVSIDATGRVTTIDLGWNNLSGEIPPELGLMSNLKVLHLAGNELTGEIPSELGQLPSLESLVLYYNQLTGDIPAELGRLSNLLSLRLDGNRLTGEIPAELGRLSNLLELNLRSNQLVGEIPPELSDLASLKKLLVSHNSGLTGPLPGGLVELTQLEQFLAAGTSLCAPSNPAFSAWLDRLDNHRVPVCIQSSSTAYLVQAVQSRGFPVPLVADEPALLRVFATASEETTETIPPVRATFFRNGTQVHAVDLPRGSRAVPIELTEGDLGLSANVESPGAVIREGLEMVVEVDPDGIIDPALGVKRRIPETGRQVLDVRAMPRFDMTLIPFVSSEDQDSTIVATVGDMAANPDEHELFRDTRRLLPVVSMSVRAHEPVVTSSNSLFAVLSETRAMRLMEGGSGYWMGIKSESRGPIGVAYVADWVSAVKPLSDVMAHELGHNLSLRHAPCGPAGALDPEYPYGDGSIGSWGLDFEQQRLVAPNQPDIMSYCSPGWISDYHFTKATEHRLQAESATNMATMTATPQSTLLVWGGADADSVPSLRPSFLVDARPITPTAGTTYTLSARTTDGATAFSYTFDMPMVMDDEEDRFGFEFAIPADGASAADLASITLTGPGGTAVLNGQTDDPMVILRDPRNGQVRAFLRNPPVAAMTANGVDPSALSSVSGLEALFSRGLPRGSNR